MEIDVAEVSEDSGWVSSQASDNEAWSRMIVIGSVVGMLLKSPALLCLSECVPAMEVENAYSYHISAKLSGLLCKFGKFPCIHQSMSAMMFGAPFAPFSKELISVSVTWSQHSFLRTHVGIKYLNLSKSRVRNQDACSGLAYEPVPSNDIERRTVQRVGVNSRGNYRKSGEYC
jgi:hypothetical protein